MGKIYSIKVSVVGTGRIDVEADSESEALEIAECQPDCDIEWDDWATEYSFKIVEVYEDE